VGGTTRLLTLIGATGVGKTRLALEVARAAAADYAHGAALVEFAPPTEPVLVPQAVATVLHIQEQPRRPLLDVLGMLFGRSACS
jgi:predicted ATPase